jgi:hypothetical protein
VSEKYWFEFIAAFCILNSPFLLTPAKKETQELRTLAAHCGFQGQSSVAFGVGGPKEKKGNCAMNALAKIGSQPPTPELRTSIPGSSRHKKAQLLETALRKTETSHPKLRHLAPLSTSYANFSVRKAISSKAETGALRVRASKLSNHSPLTFSFCYPINVLR